MQAHSLEVFSLAKIVFYPKKFYYPLLLPSHNCINNHNVQFSRCIFKFLFQETQWRFNLLDLQSISWMMVESTGIEPVTSCLQGRRSPSWANPPYRRNQIHNLRIYLFKLNARLCLCFSSQIKTRFAGLLICLDMTFRSGGPKWTRTIDLTIISRVL